MMPTQRTGRRRRRLLALSLTTLWMVMLLSTNEPGHGVNADDELPPMFRNLQSKAKSHRAMLLQDISEEASGVSLPLEWDWSGVIIPHGGGGTVRTPDRDSRSIKSLCESTVKMIRNQGECNSCFAIAAADSISDRMCILHQRQQRQRLRKEPDSGAPPPPPPPAPRLGVEGMLSCCPKCGFGCRGGKAKFAWQYLADTGALAEECLPYSESFPPCRPSSRFTRSLNEEEGHTTEEKFGERMVAPSISSASRTPPPLCSQHGHARVKNSCSEFELRVNRSLEQSTQPRCGQQKNDDEGIFRKRPAMRYFGPRTVQLIQGEADMVKAIVAGGPVEARMHLRRDLSSYNQKALLLAKGTRRSPLTGRVRDYIYRTVGGDTEGLFLGHHTVRIVGFGEQQSQTQINEKEKYWIAANSWGTEFGIDGFFKIHRGSNECNIEQEVTAGEYEGPDDTGYSRMEKL